jgi:hypothetical protein
MVLLSCEMGASLLIDSQNEAFETLQLRETEADGDGWLAAQPGQTHSPQGSLKKKAPSFHHGKSGAKEVQVDIQRFRSFGLRKNVGIANSSSSTGLRPPP